MVAINIPLVNVKRRHQEKVATVKKEISELTPRA